MSKHIILIVEDDEDDAALLDMAFDSAHVTVDRKYVTDGEVAIQYLDGTPPYGDRAAFPFPNLLILDIKMARKDGFDVLEWLGTVPHPPLPVVMWTGSTYKKDEERAMALGAAGFETKSGDLGLNAATIKAICARFLPETVLAN